MVVIVWSEQGEHTVYRADEWGNLVAMSSLIEDDGDWWLDDDVIHQPEGDPLDYLTRMFAPDMGPSHDTSQPIMTYAYGVSRFDVWGVTE